MLQRQQIKGFILENFLFSNDDKAIGDQDSLIWHTVDLRTV